MAILHLSLISTITCSQRRRTTKASQDSVKTQKTLIATNSGSSFRLCPCGRRHFIGAVPLLPLSPSYAASSSTEDFKSLRPPKPDWYDELFAWSMDTSMESYEKEILSYKMKLFDNLVGKAEKVLEIGVGTGPNFKYYSAIPNVSVLGVDPNAKMESYASKSAAQAGLKPEDFSFIRAVAEAIPLENASVDAVVGTLVLCSVADVTRTLNEVKRVLRPGGVYLFIEHVAGEDGSFLRLVQNVLDPLQQVVADGCHLTRCTGDYILEARFNGGADINKASLSSLAYLSSHLTGLCHCFPSILLVLRDQGTNKDLLVKNVFVWHKDLTDCLQMPSLDVSETFHPQGTDWYKEPFAWFLSTGMRSYESEVSLLCLGCITL
ncbi:BnaC06g30740D [Brassica napus]|uniref:BnaC06g30740D protein n=1 Tax=Brassica napus TaxID=3708 RepID=A0A078HT71_BRANA|nr:BnaC06g30740D [Brassica napus]